MYIDRAGVNGDAGNPFEGDTWGPEDVVDVTSDQSSRATVSDLQQKCPAEKLSPPGNPTTISAFASAVLDHVESSLTSAAQVASLTAQSGEVKTRLEPLEN